MKKRGFVIVYLLPIFLVIIALSIDVLQNIKTSFKLTNNYLGKEQAICLSEIGIRHGINTSKGEMISKSYYINLINNSIGISEYSEGEMYAKVDISVKEDNEKTKVIINSNSHYDIFSHSLKSEYILEKEKPSVENIDNVDENLDTKENTSFIEEKDNNILEGENE